MTASSPSSRPQPCGCQRRPNFQAAATAVELIRIDIDVQFVSTVPVLTFHTSKFFIHKQIAPCIWSLQIIDEARQEPAITRRNAAECIIAYRVSLDKPTEGLIGAGDVSSLKKGQRYHAELIAEGGMGRSEPWVQP